MIRRRVLDARLRILQPVASMKAKRIMKRIESRTVSINNILLDVRGSSEEAGLASGRHAAAVIRNAIEERGQARVLFASAPSQDDFMRTLVSEAGISWGQIQAFHIDEYVGIPPSHPQSFGRWVAGRLLGTGIASFERIRAHGDLDVEMRRYSRELLADDLDLACLGIGVNGHLAFNEPDDFDPEDPEQMRLVELDLESRIQQVDDECFESLEQVPSHALTLTIPALLRAKTLVVTVVGPRKANSLRAAIEGVVDRKYPASYLQMHQDVRVYADEAAAALLGSGMVFEG